MMEEAKRIAEELTGVGRPSAEEARKLIRRREPETFLLEDDGKTPNNPTFPLVLYRDAIDLPDDYDPAAVMEEIFGANGWGKGWRNGIFDFLHFHTQTHEVLGIARGDTRVQFGGAKGPILAVKAEISSFFRPAPDISASRRRKACWWSAHIRRTVGTINTNPERSPKSRRASASLTYLRRRRILSTEQKVR